MVDARVNNELEFGAKILWIFKLWEPNILALINSAFLSAVIGSHNYL